MKKIEKKKGAAKKPLTAAQVAAKKEALAYSKSLPRHSAKQLAKQAEEVKPESVVVAPVKAKAVPAKASKVEKDLPGFKNGHVIEKAPQAPEAEALKVRLYGKGEFYFSKPAGERIGDAPYLDLAIIKGKTITLTPCKKTGLTVGKCHAAKVLRAAKALEATGWSKQTQNLIAQPHGTHGLKLTIS